MVVCSVCRKPVTRQRDIHWFADKKGKPIHWHCANYLIKEKTKSWR